MATKTCIKCGAQFESKGPAKYCLACRMKGYANYKHKPKTVSEISLNNTDLKDDLDKKLDDLHAAGTTYAAAQKAETLANIPKIEVPEHLLRVETPEAMMVEPGSGGNGADYISQVNEDLAKAFDEGRQAAADAGWYFCRAILNLPDDLRDRLLALDYQDAVEEAKRIKSLLSLALGIR